MTKIISFLSEKGGSGKTTLSTNVACAIKRYYNCLNEREVLLCDSDPQGSSRKWNEASEGRMVPVIGLDRDTLSVDIKSVGYGYEHIIIDGVPRISKVTAATIRVSDLVIIPIHPSPYDIWAIEDLVNLIKLRQEISEGIPKAAFLISCAVKGTLLRKEVSDIISEAGYDFPILNSGTTKRVSYPTSAKTGMSVFETNDICAIGEINGITNEILQILDINFNVKEI